MREATAMVYPESYSCTVKLLLVRRVTALYVFGLYQKARSNPLPAVREKYSQPKYACIARADPPPELPDSLFFDLHVL